MSTVPGPRPDAATAEDLDEVPLPEPVDPSPWDPKDVPAPSDPGLFDGGDELLEEEMPAPPTPSPAQTREQRRSRRKREVRAHTISIKRMTKREIAIGRLLYPPDEDRPQRPKTRGECAGGERPCPFVSCKHHLYLDVNARTGSIKQNFPDLEPHEMSESCALDVADRGGTTLEEVGAIMNLTRERIRQCEVKGLAQLRGLKESRQAAEDAGLDPDAPPRRRLPVIQPSEDVEEDDEDEELLPAAAAPPPARDRVRGRTGGLVAGD